ncbi:MAG: isoprenylcysteine carboxylmethyltransferase family protein [Anaerolineae bacterium]|nr:isoprenylcysteine carboxylmethyltransferase family protein [Anaerolineae bacterium]
METFFRISTALVLVCVCATSFYFRRRANLKGGKLRSQEGQRPLAWLRLLALIIWIPILAYLINPDLISGLRVALPDWVRVVGLVAIAVDSVLVFWMFRSLDTNITPVHEARENAKLVTSGPYRWIRHPLYAFGFALLVSLALVTGIWWLAACAAIFIGFFALWRVPKEEAKLIEVFGDAYRQYMGRTGRFLPKFRT